ncbi:TC1D4 protein, partial [Turnix velox]|nr:TC1D4 protein [Turnix velox]
MTEQLPSELAQMPSVDGAEAPPLQTSRRGSQPAVRGGEDGKQPPLLPSRRSSILSTQPAALASRRSSILSSQPVALSSRRSSLGMAPGTRRSSIGPWMLHSRVSFSGLPIFQPVLKPQLENTYRMGPDPGCRFEAGRVHRVLEGALAGTLGTTLYNPQGCAQLAQSLAELLRSRVKEVVSPRYKLVCHVLLGQRGQQSLLVASRALWDPESDSFASATFSNTSLFAVATVHGVYFE